MERESALHCTAISYNKLIRENQKQNFNTIVIYLYINCKVKKERVKWMNDVKVQNLCSNNLN